MQVITKNTKDLKNYKGNARRHSEAQVAQLMNSIENFGFNVPVLIDEKNEIIAGHGRLAAALKLGMSEVPCIAIEGLNDAQKRAYRIADNKIALNSDWDFEVLKIELESLESVELTGFSDNELDALLNGGADFTIDEPKEEVLTAPDEFKGDTSDKFSVLVYFDNEQDTESFFHEMQERKLECKILL